MGRFQKAIEKFIVGYCATFILCTVAALFLASNRWMFHGKGFVDTLFNYYPTVVAASLIVGVAFTFTRRD